jgi:hypothetical protein
MTNEDVLNQSPPAGKDHLLSLTGIAASTPAGTPPSPVQTPLKAAPKTEFSSTDQDVAGGLKHIGALAESVSRHFKQAVSEIGRINLQTKVLSLNAQIESARAGVVGNAFGVVAAEMVQLSSQTAEVTKRLATETQDSINSLNEIIVSLGVDIRGTRLSDLALTNIDVIDRNLYERSCDVRWWATDSSAVDALTSGTKEAREHACQRLGVILDSYTVYFDIVLCDLEGRVVANGRRTKFPCIGTSQVETGWFQEAIKTSDGTKFGFQGVHRSETLAGRQHILVYSCGVREHGDAQGRLIGVLGIVFNWEALGQIIVNRTFIGSKEQASSRVCIVDADGLVLADSAGRIISERLELPDQKSLFATKKIHRAVRHRGEPALIAHAFSPGFETYATGWHSLIIQPLNQD